MDYKKMLRSTGARFTYAALLTTSGFLNLYQGERASDAAYEALKVPIPAIVSTYDQTQNELRKKASDLELELRGFDEPASIDKIIELSNGISEKKEFMEENNANYEQELAQYERDITPAREARRETRKWQKRAGWLGLLFGIGGFFVETAKLDSSNPHRNVYN